jgi:hypothetical protein
MTISGSRLQVSRYKEKWPIEKNLKIKEAALEKR